MDTSSFHLKQYNIIGGISKAVGYDQIGYVGVVNRSQSDINGRKNMLDSLFAERMFFMFNPAYASVTYRLGTTILQRCLNKQLSEKIRLKLPSLRDQIQKRIQEMAETVKQFKKFDPSQSGSKMKTLVLYV